MSSRFMDALGVGRAVMAGFDWGARTADIVAAAWPQRCKALVSVSGYLIVNPLANQRPLTPEAEHGWWYQYYFATERGRPDTRNTGVSSQTHLAGRVSDVELRRRHL